MSRTFRKKKAPKSDACPDQKWVGSRFIALDGKDRMRALHREFGDKRSGRRNAPKWFRQQLEKIASAKERRAMYDASTLEEDTTVFPIRKKNKNWEWF